MNYPVIRRVTDICLVDFGMATATKPDARQPVQLAVPEVSLTRILRDGKEFVRDPVRRTFVRLTPEEWVRQYTLAYLIDIVRAPVGLIAVEKAFTYNGMRRRADIIVFDRSTNPLIIVECKSPDMPVTQAVFDQVSRYNTAVRAPYVIVTNGSVHYCFRVDFDERSHRFLARLPEYGQL